MDERLSGNIVNRTLALMIDGLLLIIMFPFNSVFLSTFFLSKQELGTYINSAMCTTLIYLFISYCYYIICTAKFGKTFGKKCLRLQVVTLNGTLPGYKQAFLRYLPFIILTSAELLIFLLFGSLYKQGTEENIRMFLGIASIIWLIASVVVLLRNPINRTIHDFIAGTRVVNVIKY